MATQRLILEPVDAAYIKMAYGNLRPGGHFFDRDTMRFFNTRMGEAWRVGDVFLFVTSEVRPHGNRSYSVRQMNSDGNITTVGEFCKMTRSAAIKQLRETVKANAERQELATDAFPSLK